jgi:hypothetical protein
MPFKTNADGSLDLYFQKLLTARVLRTFATWKPSASQSVTDQKEFAGGVGAGMWGGSINWELTFGLVQ